MPNFQANDIWYQWTFQYSHITFFYNFVDDQDKKYKERSRSPHRKDHRSPNRTSSRLSPERHLQREDKEKRERIQLLSSSNSDDDSSSSDSEGEFLTPSKLMIYLLLYREKSKTPKTFKKGKTSYIRDVCDCHSCSSEGGLLSVCHPLTHLSVWDVVRKTNMIERARR